MQRLEKSAILVGKARGIRVALGKSDRRVQFQHNVITRGTHIGNRASDAVGIANRVIDRMTQLTQQLPQMIVELHAHPPEYSTHLKLYCYAPRLTSLHFGTVVSNSPMAAIFKPRRTLDSGVLQSQRERCFRFSNTIFTRCCAERIFRQAVARAASTISRNDGHNVRASRAGHIDLGVSCVAAWHIALDYRGADCVCTVDDLFFRDVISQRAKSSLTRDSI